MLAPLLLLVVLFAVLPLMLGAAAAYGATPDHEDAVLKGSAVGPCAAGRAGADYAGGIDAAGRPVIPAEGPDAAPAVQVPGETMLVHRDGVEIPVQLRGLNAALDPNRGCDPTVTNQSSAHP